MLLVENDWNIPLWHQNQKRIQYATETQVNQQQNVNWQTLDRKVNVSCAAFKWFNNRMLMTMTNDRLVRMD